MLTAGACLLAHSCLAASGVEVKQDKNAPASPASLLGSLDSTNAATRFYAVDSLGKIGGSESIGPLVKALHDPDACVRIAAAKALGHSTNPTAISSLIDILKTEEDADVWNMAAKPLVDTGRSAIPAILEVFLKAEGLEVRASIGRALSQLGWKPQTQEEQIAYYSSDIVLHSDELAAIGPAAIPSLVKLLAEGDVGCRETAIQTLNCITDYRVFKPLLKALINDPSPVVRRAALVSLRVVSFDYVRKTVGIKGYLLLLACRFLASLVLSGIALILYFRPRHDAQLDSSGGRGTMARYVGALLSSELLFALCCSASLLLFAIYNIDEMKFDFMYGPLCILFPGIVMVFVSDIVRMVFKVAEKFKGESGKVLSMGRPFVWLKRAATVGWGVGLIYFFVSASLGYIQMSNAVKYNVLSEQSAAAQTSTKNTLTTEEEARKFASIVGQAKDAVKSVDSRYLDHQQKEQVMDTFVKLISIRSPSKAEGRISDELRQMLKGLGAKEIDCRKGGTNAPFNLVMELAASENLKDAPAIMLNAHIDTVDNCQPEGLEFDKVRGTFYHRDNEPYGADDKSGVTMVVEALRTLKRDYWDKGHSHRRILVVLTAEEERGRRGAAYLTARHRVLFDNLDFSFTVDGWLYGAWGSYEYPQTPYLFGILKGKVDTFKARQIVTIMETFAKERNKYIHFGLGTTEQGAPIDAFKFPPEAYKIVFFHTPNHGALDHRQARNNVGQLIDYVDMLVNVLVQVEADYTKAIAGLHTGAHSQ